MIGFITQGAQEACLPTASDLWKRESSQSTLQSPGKHWSSAGSRNGDTGQQESCLWLVSQNAKPTKFNNFPTMHESWWLPISSISCVSGIRTQLFGISLSLNEYKFPGFLLHFYLVRHEKGWMKHRCSVEWDVVRMQGTSWRRWKMKGEACLSSPSDPWPPCWDPDCSHFICIYSFIFILLESHWCIMFGKFQVYIIIFWLLYRFHRMHHQNSSFHLSPHHMCAFISFGLSPPTSPLVTTNLRFASCACFFIYLPHMSEILWYLFFSVCLTLLSKIYSWSITSLQMVRFCLFIAEKYFVVYTYIYIYITYHFPSIH